MTMPVLLSTSEKLPPEDSYQSWCAIGARARHLPRDGVEEEAADRLEDAFDAMVDTWQTLAKRLAEEPTAALAHAPACASNASDLGLMLAWTSLARNWAKDQKTILIICDDPWMFRHLAAMPGITAGRTPPLWSRSVGLAARGFVARTCISLRMAASSVLLRKQRRAWRTGGSVLLVYGHPQSEDNDEDAYFGPLMRELPDVRRVLHVDCPVARARALASNRTSSLHAWGNPLSALCLVFSRWRPSTRQRRGPHGWLVRRAEAIEGGTAQGAMIRWQRICQHRWLSRTRPAIVAWPWENHAWERDFVRHARVLGVRTVGYQHSTIGLRERNYAITAGPSGLAAAPDHIIASGPLGRTMLERLGWPSDRIEVGGALRYGTLSPLPFDPAGPVFVALPFDPVVAGEMVEAARRVASPARQFQVKDHPMTPFTITDGPYLRRCTTTLREQEGLSAVIYAGTSVGLEAMIGGLPTIRFQSGSRVSVDTLPEDRPTAVATAKTLGAALDAAARPPPIEPGEVFAQPAIDRWRRLLTSVPGDDA